MIRFVENYRPVRLIFKIKSDQISGVQAPFFDVPQTQCKMKHNLNFLLTIF